MSVKNDPAVTRKRHTGRHKPPVLLVQPLPRLGPLASGPSARLRKLV
jgi:hypothetical protein